MSAYCTNDDVFQCLSAQAFIVRARPFDGIDAATGTIRLKAHGLTVDDLVTFEVTSGGTLPTGVSAFTPYYPIPVSFDLFKVATTPSGTPLTFVSGGSGWAIAVDPLRRLAFHREKESALIDEHLTAHDPPIQVDTDTGKYPPQLVAIAARMTARAAVTSLQIENAAYKIAVDRLVAQEEFDKIILADWKRGKPLQPRPVDLTPSVADNGAVVASAVPCTDWQGRL